AAWLAMAGMAGGAAMAFWSEHASAADVAQAPAPVRTALEAAWARHPLSTATDATLEAAQARSDAAAQPLYNPEFEVNADDEGPDRTVTAGIGLTLDLNGKRKARATAAWAQLDTATAEARLRRRDFAQAWLDAWAATTAAERRVSLGSQRLALITRFADLADRQFKVGDISSLDRDLAWLARDEAGAEQAALLAELANAQEALQRVDTGSPETAPGTARPEFPDAASLPAVGDPTVDVSTLPEWVLGEAGAEFADAQVKVAERDRIADPTVSLRGGSIELADGVRDEMFGLSISVPLFVRNSYRAEVVAAKADARVAAADLARLRLELDARAARTAATYEAIHKAWRQWHRSPGTDVERRATLLERLWRAGELSTTDYLLQLQQTLDTALAGADLEGRLWSSYTDYLAASGQLESWLGLAAARSD
ncbi:MAG: TolC family protein, partial [Steroidobacteraceae bacterium]|nr:TolC family protein [Steroidobacteraceae bacterium]